MTAEAGPLPAVNPRFADTVFCDQIRREDSGKLLFVGVYGSKLILPELPSLIPNLALFVRINTPLTSPFHSLVTEVAHDDTVLVTAPAEDSMLRSLRKRAADFTGETKRSAQIMTVIDIGPLPILAPGIIRVRVQTESEILLAGTLSIEVKDETDSE